MYRAAFALRLLFLGLPAGALALGAPASKEASIDVMALLKQADAIKTSNHAEFVRILEQLHAGESHLPAEQEWYLNYLEAWEVAYEGEYDRAGLLLGSVINQSVDGTLRFRATATLIDILGIGRHYEEAFSRLSQLIDQLPSITDKAARLQGLGEASQLLISAGQYELASNYAEKMLEDFSEGGVRCKGLFMKTHASYRNNLLKAEDPRFQDAIDACTRSGESVYADTLRADMADLYIRSGHGADAIALLEKNYDDVQRGQYRSLISQFDATLAEAYERQGNAQKAESFARAAVDSSIKDEYTEPLGKAYEVLYQVARQRGDFQAALGWHEKYMEADKGYLSDVSAKTLAYQLVQQQVQAKKQQLDALGKQNRILQLQQALDRQAVKNSRLSIALLLTVLGGIAFWIFRLMRSHARLRKLSHRDDLTGIVNRRHFMDEAERELRQAQRSTQGVCLILIDLDHFRRINDSKGPTAGDEVLRRVVAVCQRHLRATDILGRLDGQELGILLPDCPIDQVIARAELIRGEIAALSDGEAGVSISASIGVASTWRCGYELPRLLAGADGALRQARRNGRNRVASVPSEDYAATP